MVPVWAWEVNWMASNNRATAQSPTVRAALSEKRRGPEGVLDHIGEGDDLIAGMFNSEPLTVIDAIEASAERLSGVRIHQMLPIRERRHAAGGDRIHTQRGARAA